MNIKNGYIHKNINILITQLKKNPMDLNTRLKLIQFYSLDANWNRALDITNNFLRLHPDEHVETLLKNNISCEISRHQVLTGEIPPLSYDGYPFDDIQFLLLQDYLQGSTNNIHEKFNTLIERANFTAVIHTYNQQIYKDTWIDSDFRFTSILEIFIQNYYYWLPLNAIATISFQEHEVLTDILWRRANITFQDGKKIAAFIPARYPIFHDIQDLLKLNRITEWQNIENLFLAHGQKMLTSGNLDVAILDIKNIQITDLSHEKYS